MNSCEGLVSARERSVRANLFTPFPSSSSTRPAALFARSQSTLTPTLPTGTGDFTNRYCCSPSGVGSLNVASIWNCPEPRLETSKLPLLSVMSSSDPLDPLTPEATTRAPATGLPSNPATVPVIRFPPSSSKSVRSVTRASRMETPRFCFTYPDRDTCTLPLPGGQASRE